MKPTLCLALLAAVVCFAPAGINADDSQLATSDSRDLESSKPGADAFCSADCIGAPDIFCSAATCSAQDSTCSTPGHIICNGVRTDCGHDSTPSVSLSCEELFRRIDCTANVSGGTGSYSYSWDFTGTASYWNDNGDDAWASWPPTGCYGTNTFEVTVTDSVCGGSDYDSDTTFCN